MPTRLWWYPSHQMAHPTPRRHQPPNHCSDPKHSPRDPVYILDRESVRSVDAAALEEYGIPGVVLMENASRALASQALVILEKAGASLGEVLIICGSGNNGGDGWALARHMHNAGAKPVVVALGDPKPETDAGVNCEICRKMGIEEIPVDSIDERREADLIVDAIFGTGLTREITGKAEEVIEWINATSRPVLAVDVPSGLDCDTGETLGACVKATCTVSFVGYKPGFTKLAAQPLVGEVVIGDIGAPRELTERFGRPMEESRPAHRRKGT